MSTIIRTERRRSLLPLMVRLGILTNLPDAQAAGHQSMVQEADDHAAKVLAAIREIVRTGRQSGVSAARVADFAYRASMDAIMMNLDDLVGAKLMKAAIMRPSRNLAPFGWKGQSPNHGYIGQQS